MKPKLEERGNTIIKLYESEEYSTCEIAKLYGVSTTTVVSFLKKNGVKLRGKRKSHYSDFVNKYGKQIGKTKDLTKLIKKAVVEMNLSVTSIRKYVDMFKERDLR